MKTLVLLATTFLLVSTTAAQTADGQLVTSTVDNTYSVQVQLKGDVVEELATSTLRFTFNTDVLSFPASPVKDTDYSYQNYDGLVTVSPLVVYDSNVTNNSGEISVNIVHSTTDGQDLPTSFFDVVSLDFAIVGTGLTDLQWTLIEVFKVPGGVADQYTNGSFPNVSDMVDPALPVELISFDGTSTAQGAVLRWSTASESAHDGFAIENAPAVNEAGAKTWTEIGYVDGLGSESAGAHYVFRVADLAVGRHAFRLKSISVDGSSTYSAEVLLSIEVSGQYTLGGFYPNPFSDRAGFTLAVKQLQNVQIGLFDILGREVTTIYDGAMRANESYRLDIDAGSLPSGLYLVRALGEHFVTTRTVTLTR